MPFVDQLSAFARDRIGLKPSLSAPRIEAMLRAVPEGDRASFCRDVLDAAEEDAAFRSFVEALLVHETYFFRHPDQLRVLSEDVFPGLVRERIDSGRREIRIWCAGCSSGEEVYTVALLLQAAILSSALPSLHSWTATIVGSDFSDLALSQARRGEYSLGPGLHSFRDVPLAARHHFPSIFGGRPDGWSASAELRKMVSFRRHNLVADPPAITDADVVLCRNTIIYFDDRESARAIASLESALRPGGVLVLGPAEMPRDAPKLRMTCTPQAVYWTKAEAG